MSLNWPAVKIFALIFFLAEVLIGRSREANELRRAVGDRCLGERYVPIAEFVKSIGDFSRQVNSFRNARDARRDFPFPSQPAVVIYYLIVKESHA